MALTDMLTPGSFVVAFIAIVFVQLYGGNDRKAMATLQQREHSAVLITGASRGIGKVIAAHLSFVGYTVFACVRSDASYKELEGVSTVNIMNAAAPSTATGRIIPVKLDVTDEKQIAKAVTVVQTKCKELNVDFMGIINNAGINPEGEALAKIYYEGDNKEGDGEGEGDDIAEPQSPENILADSETVTKVLDVNVVGCFRVTKAFLPLLKKPKSSDSSSTHPTTRRVILIGSYLGTIAGALGLPHLAYESSKFALEALADGLRRGFKNDDDYNFIKVSLIKPGNIQTDMNKFAGETPPVAISHDVLTALESKKPNARYYPGMVKGLPCKQLCDFFALFPTFITDTQVSIVRCNCEVSSFVHFTYVVDWQRGKQLCLGDNTRSILDCEKEAVLNLNSNIAQSGIAIDVGVVEFNSNARALDVDDTTPGEQVLAPPGNLGVEAAINGLTTCCGTNFQAGITAAIGVVEQSLLNPAVLETVIVFITDGFSSAAISQSQIDQLVQLGTKVFTFAIGGNSQCSTDLEAVSTATGAGSCTRVVDASHLDRVFEETFTAERTVTSVALTVDGMEAGSSTNPPISRLVRNRS